MEKPQYDVSMPETLKAFFEFYRENLSEVSFPDFDAQLIASSMERLEASSQKMMDLEEQLVQAQESVKETEEELWQLARRGLAYLKIYAQGRPEFETQLAQMDLKTSGVRESLAKNDLKKRGRKSKIKVVPGDDSASLT